MIPEFLKNKLISQYGEIKTSEIINNFNQNRVVSLRINNLKTTKSNILKILKENNISYKELSWYDNALIIDKSEDMIKELSIYKNGEIYLQSLSSQLPPLFLNPQEKETILDMTAAPGGKTTQIAALTNNTAMITAIEKNKIRSERLQYNIEKQGAKKVSILNIDARKIDNFFIFDKILLDAPCSGSGTLLTTQNIDEKISEKLINNSSLIQKELLNKAIKHLKIGGEIIYSTCSILKEENENIINSILEENKNVIIEPLDLKKFQELPKLPTLIKGTLCVLPNELYEGFFVAKLKKIEK